MTIRGPQDGAVEDAPASRWRRAWAYVIDHLLLVVTAFPGQASGDDALAGLGFLAVLGVVGWQWWRLARDGTTFGKRTMGLRVVDHRGRPPGFLRGVVIRQWPKGAILFLAAAIHPASAWAALLLDAAGVHAQDRRALHDRLAGTLVVAAPGAWRLDHSRWLSRNAVTSVANAAGHSNIGR